MHLIILWIELFYFQLAYISMKEFYLFTLWNHVEYQICLYFYVIDLSNEQTWSGTYGDRNDKFSYNTVTIVFKFFWT